MKKRYSNSINGAIIGALLGSPLIVLALPPTSQPSHIEHQASSVSTSQPQSKKRLVVIDPGHGMSNSAKGTYDPGAVREGIEEATINLRVAAYLGQDLIAKGYAVILTRLDNQTHCPITKRNQVSNKLNADAFISLHCNSSKSEETKATGVRVFYSPKRQADKTLAAALEDAASQTLTEGVRGYSEKNQAVYKGNFLVLNTSRVPAVLVEMGYINSPFDREYLIHAERLIARGISKGLERHFSK